MVGGRWWRLLRLEIFLGEKGGERTKAQRIVRALRFSKRTGRDARHARYSSEKRDIGLHCSA